MKARPFRLNVEEVENRITPTGTPADVFMAVQQIQMNTAILQFVTDDQIIGNPMLQPYVGNFLNYVHHTSTAAAGELNLFISNMMGQNLGDPTMAAFYGPHIVSYSNHLNEAQSGIMYAKMFADSMNIPISPPPAFLPPGANSNGIGSGNGNGNGNNGSGGNNGGGGDNDPTYDLTSDSGMVNAKPDTSTAAFVDIGNGVKIKDIVVGSGTTAMASSSVSVYYTGWLASDGTQFDANRSPNAAIPFDLDGTIPGFRAAVAGMKPGGIRQFFIPAAQAYGSAGQGNIPPNADLVFEVKLISTTAS